MGANLYVSSDQIPSASGTKTIGPFTIVCGNFIGDTVFVTVTNVAVLVPVPGGTTYAVIVPNSGTVPALLKGAPGDTGVEISIVDPSFISLNASQFYLQLPSSSSSTYEISFI